MVNGKETDYMVTPKGYRFPGKPDDMELTVKKENIFLVSIQTEHFYDSRMWGTVSKDSIRGVSIYPAD
jgi:type IV secretory pathway protease TraF